MSAVDGGTSGGVHSTAPGAMTPERSADVVVVGAGIAGLVAAVELQRAGMTTVLLERSDAVGGLVRPTVIDGVTVDAGAESFAVRNDSVAQLIADLGLDLTIVEPNQVGALLLVPGQGSAPRLNPLPRGTVLGIPSNPWASDVRASIGFAGALRASLDGFLPSGYASDATTVGELAGRRMGSQVKNVLVDSICRSVYSTPADDLAVDAVAPRLRDELAATGSLAAAAGQLAAPTRAGGAVRGIAGGLWRLADALAEAFTAAGGRLLTQADVTAIAAAGDGGWSVSYVDAAVPRTSGQEDSGSTSTSQVSAGHLVLATTGPQALRLIDAAGQPGMAITDPQRFGDVTVALARIRSSWLDEHPVGTGVIVASPAAKKAKALTHANAKWAWLDELLPAHEHVLRLSFDGTDAATLAAASDKGVVAAEISHIIGVPVAQTDILSVQAQPWRDAVVPADPQIRDDQVRLLDEWAAHGGPTVIGSWVSGTGLASVVPDARAAARRIMDTAGVTPGGPPSAGTVPNAGAPGAGAPGATSAEATSTEVSGEARKKERI